MTASYPTSVKQWTNVTDDTDYVQAAHMNEAYEEIIAVENDTISSNKFFTATGSVNTLAVDTPITFSLTKDGNILNFLPNLSNTGAVTIAVDGQTAKAIKKYDTGTDQYTDLSSGDLKKNTPATIVWNVTNDFFVYAPKVTGAGTEVWYPKAQWQDISNPASNTISMVYSDTLFRNSFVATTSGSVPYKVTVTGGTGNVTINDVSYALGTEVSINSGTQCNIVFQSGTGKTTDYGYSTFRVDITSTGTLLTWSVKQFPASADTIGDIFNSLLWFVLNANVTSLIFSISGTGEAKSSILEYADISRTNAMTAMTTSMFEYCSRLISFKLPNSLTSIGNYCISTCYSLRSFTLPTGITSIGNSFGYYCYSLEELTIPEGVTSIGQYFLCSAFSIKSVKLPSTLTSLGSEAFDSCTSLEKITLPNITALTGSYHLRSCRMVRTLSIPASVTTLNCGTTTWFTQAYNLEYFEVLGTFSSGVTICLSPYYQSCHNLKEVYIPNANAYRLIFNASSSTHSKLHSITISPSSTFGGSSPHIDIRYCNFTATELNSLFTSLPTLTSKTMYIYGNPGTGTCDTSIATAKGWTVNTTTT